MSRLAWVLLAVVPACTSEYARPPTVDYVTETVLSPSCGAAQCHSTFKQSKGQVLDTVGGVRETLVHGPDRFIFDGVPNDATVPQASPLIVWVTQTDPYNRGIGRMPYDAPLENHDVELLTSWVAHYAPGAACDPAAMSGMACQGNDLHKCTSDWSFGDLVQSCVNGCAQGKCQ